MEELRIRAARRDDVPALSSLARRTWADAFGDSVPADDLAAELEETRSERRFESALDTRTILVAEHGGALVGYVEFGDVEIPEVPPEPGDRELHRLYVETALHGRGIGRALLAAALAHPRLAAAPRVFLQVWEENAAAVSLYESAGFRAAGRTRFTIGSGEPVEDLVLVRVS